MCYAQGTIYDDLGKQVYKWGQDPEKMPGLMREALCKSQMKKKIYHPRLLFFNTMLYHYNLRGMKTPKRKYCFNQVW